MLEGAIIMRKKEWHTDEKRCQGESLKELSSVERGLIKEIEELRKEAASLYKELNQAKAKIRLIKNLRIISDKKERKKSLDLFYKS